MLRKLSPVIVLSVVVAVPSAAAQRRGNAGTVGPATFAIVVTDPSGAPISGVKVTLSGPTQRSATTEGGRLAFENLPSGNYHFRFEHEGYTTLDRDVVGKRGAPIDVKVTLNPLPKPVPALTPPPEPAEAPAVNAKPVVLDMPSFIEKNYVGKGPGRATPLACSAGGDTTLIQINEPIQPHAHRDADEFIYVIAGQGSVRLPEHDERLSAGVFVMIPRGVTHSFSASKGPLVMLSTKAGEPCGSQR